MTNPIAPGRTYPLARLHADEVNVQRAAEEVKSRAAVAVEDPALTVRADRNSRIPSLERVSTCRQCASKREQ